MWFFNKFIKIKRSIFSTMEEKKEFPEVHEVLKVGEIPVENGKENV